MAQSGNVPSGASSQTPPEGPNFGFYYPRQYPVMWQGFLAIKNAQAEVQMHFVSGNPNIVGASLPPPDTAMRISQRMQLDPAQLDGVYRKIQMGDEHCILVALPCGKDGKDLVQQSNFLRMEFINYLLSKGAVGIVNTAVPGSHQPGFVIHIFPSCEFIQNNLNRIAPTLLHYVNEIAHLVIIITTV